MWIRIQKNSHSPSPLSPIALIWNVHRGMPDSPSGHKIWKKPRPSWQHPTHSSVGLHCLGVSAFRGNLCEHRTGSSGQRQLIIGGRLRAGCPTRLIQNLQTTARSCLKPVCLRSHRLFESPEHLCLPKASSPVFRNPMPGSYSFP